MPLSAEAFLRLHNPALAELLRENGAFSGGGALQNPDTELLRELSKAKLAAKRALLPRLEDLTGCRCDPDGLFCLCAGDRRVMLPVLTLLLSLAGRLERDPFACVPTSVFLLVPDPADGALRTLCSSVSAFLCSGNTSARLQATVLSELSEALPAAELFWLSLPSTDNALWEARLRLCGGVPAPAGDTPAEWLDAWDELAGLNGSLRFQRLALSQILDTAAHGFFGDERSK